MNKAINNCKMFSPVLVLGLVFLTGAQANLYDDKADVVKITPENFNELVIESDGVWVTQFFAPWCIHSQNLVEEYARAATALKGVVKVGAVNADGIASQFGIAGFPTVRVYSGSDITAYGGDRSAKSLVDEAIKVAIKRAYRTLDKDNFVRVVGLDNENIGEVCNV